MHTLILSQLTNTHGNARLVPALEARGHSVQLVRPLDCTIILDGGRAQVLYEGQSIAGADVALLRCVGHTRYGLTIVRAFESSVATQLEMGGTLCINSPAAKLRAHDKFLSLQILQRAGIPVPASVLTWDVSSLEQAMTKVLGEPIILKARQGSLGVGVMKADSWQSALSIYDTIRSMERVVLAQRYIGEAEGSDLRAMVVDGQVIGAFRRTARPGEFRSNIHRGASAEVVDLPSDYRSLAVAAARALNLALAGVDLLETSQGPLVLEVNPSPGWKQIELLSDIDVTALIVDYLERVRAADAGRSIRR